MLAKDPSKLDLPEQAQKANQRRARQAHSPSQHARSLLSDRQDRAAFVLNANARAVTARVAEQMREIVPAGDLFLSQSLEDAAKIADLIARRGYARVFTGGGDGTLVSTLNLLEKACEKYGRPLPQVGVLRLGTGNAVAGLLGAGRPKTDAAHISAGGETKSQKIWMVRTDEGTLAPFAGVGYDGEVLNDYLTFKDLVSKRWPFFLPLVQSVVGYLLAMLFVTVPRYVRGKKPAQVRLVSKHDAFKIVTTAGVDEEVRIPAGETIYEGPAPALCVGTVPFFGGGFKMFPHAFRKAGHMQVRVTATSIPRILLNLFPHVWNGTFRHQGLHDFLVRDVEVISDQSLAYEVGGDASGERKGVSFAVSEQPIEMLSLTNRPGFNLQAALGLLVVGKPLLRAHKRSL